MIQIDSVDEALDLLRRARDERGADYVYQLDDSGRCAYFHADYSPSAGEAWVPGCIVGQVLAYKGLTREGLRIAGGDCNKGSGVYDLSGRVLHAPEDVLRVLSQAQSKQDCGRPWGEAVQAAESVARHIAQYG